MEKQPCKALKYVLDVKRPNPDSKDPRIDIDKRSIRNENVDVDPKVFAIWEVIRRFNGKNYLQYVQWPYI